MCDIFHNKCWGKKWKTKKQNKTLWSVCVCKIVMGPFRGATERVPHLEPGSAFQVEASYSASLLLSPLGRTAITTSRGARVLQQPTQRWAWDAVVELVEIIPGVHSFSCLRTTGNMLCCWSPAEGALKASKCPGFAPRLPFGIFFIMMRNSTLLNALWWPKWEGNPKKRVYMYM